nr:MAG TPA: hypothetical protein [Caudoviricetes sp.]
MFPKNKISMGSSTYRRLTSSIFSQEYHGAEHTQRPAHTSHSRTYVRKSLFWIDY